MKPQASYWAVRGLPALTMPLTSSSDVLHRIPAHKKGVDGDNQRVASDLQPARL